MATGFIFGSEIVYFICVEENIFPLGGKIGLCVGAGLLCGLTAILIHYVGFFFAGFQFGLLSAVASLIILEQAYHPFTKWIPFGILLGTGIMAALIVSIRTVYFGFFLSSIVISIVITVEPVSFRIQKYRT